MGGIIVSLAVYMWKLRKLLSGNIQEKQKLHLQRECQRTKHLCEAEVDQREGRQYLSMETLMSVLYMYICHAVVHPVPWHQLDSLDTGLRWFTWEDSS